MEDITTLRPERKLQTGAAPTLARAVVTSAPKLKPTRATLIFFTLMMLV
jgi:hypothetical protein